MTCKSGNYNLLLYFPYYYYLFTLMWSSWMCIYLQNNHWSVFFLFFKRSWRVCWFVTWPTKVQLWGGSWLKFSSCNRSWADGKLSVRAQQHPWGSATMLPANSTASVWVHGHQLQTAAQPALRMGTVLISCLSEWAETVPPQSIGLNVVHSIS